MKTILILMSIALILISISCTITLILISAINTYIEKMCERLELIASMRVDYSRQKELLKKREKEIKDLQGTIKFLSQNSNK